MPPHFTTLPREIRDAILELCLVVGTINPYRQKDCQKYWSPFKNSTRIPDISLLAVNKAINVEAAEIFYSKNVWVINRSFNHDDSRGWGFQAPVDEIWHIHRGQIRHVQISVDTDRLGVYLWRIAMRKAYQTPHENTTTRALVETAHFDHRSLLIVASRWKMNICRELGIKDLTIALPSLSPGFDPEPLLSIEAISHGCLSPLLEWVQNEEKTRVGEPTPTSVRSYPKITLTGCPDTMRVVRGGWEKLLGPLNHSVKGDRHCLEGFFQSRDAKTIGKT